MTDNLATSVDEEDDDTDQWPPPTPLLHHIENSRRTAEQDLDYHVRAQRGFRKLVKNIDRAQAYLDAREGEEPGGSDQVRYLRRMLFAAQIAQARETAILFSKDRDASYLAFTVEDYIKQLAFDTAVYIAGRPANASLFERVFSRLPAGLDPFEAS